MNRVLVTYGSKHGSTAEIAQAIAEELQQAGASVDCLSADRVDHLDQYDAVVMGSAVYMKRWRPEARRLLRRNARALADRPFWMFSSGPCGEKPDPSWSEPARTVKRAEQLGVRDHVVFGGRLPVEPANFMERTMVRNCPPENRDLRD
jgi:menaquinone-dependent protoporphyrinogen oxidase